MLYQSPEIPGFLSTSPLRGTTETAFVASFNAPISIHVPLAGDDRLTPRRASAALISIHVPLAGDDMPWTYVDKLTQISIHVPLAGDDSFWPFPASAIRHFYPRPPCGGRRIADSAVIAIMQFLSTSPLRGTTNGRDVGPLHRQHFYPRPPCGGRPNPVHAPYTNRVFLSTSPLRGTTVVHDQLAGGLHISIHVPLAGDDVGPAE